VVLGVLISVLGTMACVTHLLIWAFFALGTLCITTWLSYFVDSKSLCIYFIVSVLGGLLFLLSRIDCLFSHIILQCALSLKLGLAPFHFWVYGLLRFLPLATLCIFLGPAKSGVLFIMVSSHSISFTFASCSLLVGISWLWLTYSASLILYASGSCQIFIFILLGPTFFVVYYMLYVISLLAVLSIRLGYTRPLLAFICLAGLPPLTMFSAKLLALRILSFVGGVLVLVISVLSFHPYLSFALRMRSQHPSSLSLMFFLCLTPLFVVFTVL